MTIARIICDNLDGIAKVPKNPFIMPDPVKNPLVDCSEIPTINYSVFKNSAYNL